MESDAEEGAGDGGEDAEDGGLHEINGECAARGESEATEDGDALTAAADLRVHGAGHADGAEDEA